MQTTMLKKSIRSFFLKLVEEAREAKVSTSRIGELEAEMKALTRKLQTPKGAQTILSIDNLKGW